MAEDLEQRLREADARLRENLRSFDLEVEFQLSNEGERADLWTVIDVNVDDLRTVLDAMEELRAAHLAAHARGAERDQECFRLEDALATSRARSEALEKVLSWYADMANWETPFHPSGYGSLASNVTNDLGKRARAALSLKQEGVAK